MEKFLNCFPRFFFVNLIIDPQSLIQRIGKRGEVEIGKPLEHRQDAGHRPLAGSRRFSH